LTLQKAQTDDTLLSPENDGWLTEAFAEAALGQLRYLGHAMSGPDDARAKQLAPLIAPDFQCSSLRPRELAELFHDANTTVRQQKPSGRPAYWQGASGFSAAVGQWITSLPNPGELDPHFKIIRVEPGDTWQTTVLAEFTSAANNVSRQINVTWTCKWQAEPAQPPRLQSIEVTNYREADVRMADSKWFTDCTTSVLGTDREILDQFGRGHHHWLQRMERVHRFDTSVRNGLAVGDVNGDGLDDLLVCQPPGLPNRLFVQNLDGTATDRAASAGVDFLDQTSAALFCDLDNDGDQDLVLGTAVGILLMQNDGQGRFSLNQTLSTDYDVQSISAADYDQDGRLDLFVCVYRTGQPSENQSFLYRDAVGGGLNRLFRNTIRDDQWSFTDETSSSGLIDGADRFSLAASWEDYDNDGDVDLYIANDFGPNYLYENQGGTFANVAAQRGVVDVGSGMSVSWGDYNRDGRMDLYVGNMFSSAGQRVTYQPSFRPGEDSEIRAVYQRLAKGNSLFENHDDGNFDEVGAEAGVELGRWAWSSVFVDLNNDGWEDLLVANGYMTTEDTGDL
jgi:hypothetical protein